jgi:hypothetical protein
VQGFGKLIQKFFAKSAGASYNQGVVRRSIDCFDRTRLGASFLTTKVDRVVNYSQLE